MCVCVCVCVCVCRLLRYCNAVYNQNIIDRLTKGCILPFPKEGDLGKAKDYRDITLTYITAKIFNALPFNNLGPESEKVLRKNQNCFRRNRGTTSKNIDNQSNIGRRSSRNPRGDTIISRFLYGI